MQCPKCRCPETGTLEGVERGSRWSVLNIIPLPGGEFRCLMCRQIWHPDRPIPKPNRDIRDPGGEGAVPVD